jgi:hypothetical protein
MLVMKRPYSTEPCPCPCPCPCSMSFLVLS